MEAPAARVVTADELALIKTTVAVGATDAELKLFLFDCQRQGVHPLDKLIHFTKRGGKYTPVTSIDFMRIRAAESGEYAGNEDAYFSGTPMGADFTARVSVYRIVQAQRCEFVATARWSEYKPAEDFMWRKMPHTMLGKCAEALALRKGFPRQLAGLYAKEEMDQADTTPTVGGPTAAMRAPQHAGGSGARLSGAEDPGAAARAPDAHPTDSPPPAAQTPAAPSPVAPRVGASGHVSREPGEDDELPAALLVTSVEVTPTKNPNVKKALVNFSDGRVRSTINTALITAAANFRDGQVPVRVQDKRSKWGWDLVTLERAS